MHHLRLSSRTTPADDDGPVHCRCRHKVHSLQRRELARSRTGRVGLECEKVPSAFLEHRLARAIVLGYCSCCAVGCSRFLLVPYCANPSRAMLCCTRYFETPFHWVDGAIKSGGGVLVHCLAGAHRAGTVRAPTTASQLITHRDHTCVHARQTQTIRESDQTVFSRH
jgi:hypothetical protein